MRNKNRNWWNRRYVVIQEPVACRNGRLFELKIRQAELKGFEMVGHPTFLHDAAVTVGNQCYGAVLMRQKGFK